MFKLKKSHLSRYMTLDTEDVLGISSFGSKPYSSYIYVHFFIQQKRVSSAYSQITLYEDSLAPPSYVVYQWPSAALITLQSSSQHHHQHHHHQQQHYQGDMTLTSLNSSRTWRLTCM